TGALVAALPSTWFARFWLPGDAGAGVFERAGVLALVVGSVLIGTSGVLDRRYVHLIELQAQPPAGAVAPPLVVRLLAGLGRLPSPPGWPGGAGASLPPTRGGDLSRPRFWLPGLWTLVFFAVGSHEGGTILRRPMLSSLAFWGMIEGLAVPRHSAHAEAS